MFAPLAAACGFDGTGGDTARERFALFALLPGGKEVDKGWLNFHLLLWKYTIYQLVIVETEDAKFQPHEIWQAAWSRFKRKAAAKLEAVRTDLLRADSRGIDPPDVRSKGRCMEPIARLNMSGELVWDAELVKIIEKAASNPRKK